MATAGNDPPAEKHIDKALLSGRHHWNDVPEERLSFRQYVHEGSSPRFDMEKYRMVSNLNPEDGKMIWGKMGALKSLYRIPDTIRCDRTLARDAEEAYYVDSMSEYLSSVPCQLKVCDMPFIKRPLQGRLHCGFNRRTGYFKEHEERRRIGILVPHDAYENVYLSDAELTACYPKTKAWYHRICQPSAMPIPGPFVVYYFHKELRDAQIDLENGSEISERNRRLLFCLEHEFYVFFVSTWMLEACYGRKQFVLDTDTIDILEEKVGCLEEIVGNPVSDIIQLMRSAANLPLAAHNWVSFKDRNMEKSAFVWALPGTGQYDQETPARQTVWTTQARGRITMQQIGSNIERRNTLLEKIFPRADIEKVHGLREVINDHGGSITVPCPLDPCLTDSSS